MKRSGGASPPVGLILAGGRGRRMGGLDKPLLEIGGRAILERVAARLRPQCDGLVVSANGDLARYAALGAPVVADATEDFLGPLAGVLAGLDWIAAHRPDASWALSAPADAPFLPEDLVARLAAARGAAGAEMACARSGGRRHPVVALWPIALREDLRAALHDEKLTKVGAFLERRGCVCADWDASPLDPFFNVNAPEDLAAARAARR
ncbi:molybdenum cofactor guanylyltransferase MobA [Methylocella sp.]|uniref:molybdenum cofactor guanylyltransferase MobA n=1 Tax=Methylocella sp. TaxID=1978226 RepID=UPI0037844109